MVTVWPRSDFGFQLSDAELLLIGQGRGCVQTRGAWRDALRHEFEGLQRGSVRRKDPSQKRGGQWRRGLSWEWSQGSTGREYRWQR